jgi:hypothetical protein
MAYKAGSPITDSRPFIGQTTRACNLHLPNPVASLHTLYYTSMTAKRAAALVISHFDLLCCLHTLGLDPSLKSSRRWSPPRFNLSNLHSCAVLKSIYKIQVLQCLRHIPSSAFSLSLAPVARGPYSGSFHTLQKDLTERFAFAPFAVKVSRASRFMPTRLCAIET